VRRRQAFNAQDVRELVPEFYCMSEFLVNRNKFELGVTQRGARVEDVELPPWAKGSPKEFIRLHRKALESEHVSEHLHEWIDLVFGFRQRGREAIAALNVFHPLTYEGEVDVDNIKDKVTRDATLAQIHSYGQTPRKLFDAPHPRKLVPSPEDFAWCVWTLAWGLFASFVCGLTRGNGGRKAHGAGGAAGRARSAGPASGRAVRGRERGRAAAAGLWPRGRVHGERALGRLRGRVPGLCRGQGRGPGGE
jgi:hypothetical protein